MGLYVIYEPGEVFRVLGLLLGHLLDKCRMKIPRVKHYSPFMLKTYRLPGTNKNR